MIEYSGQDGGRYTYIDDIINLQELSLAFGSIFSECDNFIVSGCKLKDGKISSGFVYINGKIRHFAGAGNISEDTVYIYEMNKYQNVAYVDSNEKVGRKIYSCNISTSIPSTVDNITNLAPQFITITNSYAPRITDAFFGKYALMTNSPLSSQKVNKPVTFNDLVNFNNSITTSAKYSVLNKNGDISTYVDNDGAHIKYSQHGEIAFTKNDSVVVSFNDTPSITITPNKLTVQNIDCTELKAGSIKISGADIFNSSSDDNAGININRNCSHFRYLKVYDGKESVCLEINGEHKTIDINSSVSIYTNAIDAFVLKDNLKSKTEDTLQKNIIWKDKDDESIGSIGYYSDTNKTLYIKNNIGDVSVPSSFYVSGKIYEGEQSLETKYALSKTTSDSLKLKANTSDVYSKTDANKTFVSLQNAIEKILEAMTSAGSEDAAYDFRQLIQSISSKDGDARYLQRTNNLSEITNTELEKTAVRNNLDVYSKAQTQPKLKDSGWVNMLNSSGNGNIDKLWIRQIGNIVCIQGVINTGQRTGNISARIPNAIDAPTRDARVSYADYNDDAKYNRGVNFYLTANSRNITLQESGYYNVNTNINITYIV